MTSPRFAPPLRCLGRRAGIVVLLASVALGCSAAHEADPPSSRDCDTCGDGATCVRGVCIADCGGDPALLVDDLATELTPVANVCAVLPPGPLAVRARGDGSLDVVNAHAQAGGPRPRVFVDRHTIALPEGALAPAGPTCETTLTFRHAGAQVSLSRTLGLSPGGLPYFGVNVAAETPEGWQYEAVALVLEGRCTFRAQPYERYGGAVMVSDDPAELVVLGVAGNRLGLHREAMLLLPTSVLGGVQRFGADRVLLPTAAGHGASSLALFAASDLLGDDPPQPRAVSDFEVWPQDFVVLEARGIAGQAPYGDDAYELFAVEPAGERIPWSPGVMLASERFAQIVPAEGSRRIVLQHEHGLLVVE